MPTTARALAAQLWKVLPVVTALQAAWTRCSHTACAALGTGGLLRKVRIEPTQDKRAMAEALAEGGML